MVKKDERSLGTRILDTLEKRLSEASDADFPAVLKVVLEESLYIGLTVDLAALTGRVPLWVIDGDDFDGIRGADTILSAQRLILISVLKELQDLARMTIPLGVIPGLGDVAPFKWSWPMLNSWWNALNTIDRLPGQQAGSGQRWWRALHPLERTLMALMLPGILRVAVQATRQLIQLIK